MLGCRSSFQAKPQCAARARACPHIGRERQRTRERRFRRRQDDPNGWLATSRLSGRPLDPANSGSPGSVLPGRPDLPNTRSYRLPFSNQAVSRPASSWARCSSFSASSMSCAAVSCSRSQSAIFRQLRASRASRAARRCFGRSCSKHRIMSGCAAGSRHSNRFVASTHGRRASAAARPFSGRESPRAAR